MQALCPTPTVCRRINKRAWQFPPFSPSCIGERSLPDEPVFVQSECHIGQRVNAALLADSVDTSFSHLGTAQNLTITGVELPALMTAGRWKRFLMPTRYTARQAAGRWQLPGITRGRGLDPKRDSIQPPQPVHLASLFFCGGPSAVGHQSHANETPASVGLLHTYAGQCHSLPLHSL